MASVAWKSGALAVAQVDTITVAGTWATNDTATITCAGKSITFTVAGVQTAAAVVTGLVAAWNLSTVLEHTEITAADGAGDTITMTADTAGVPFTITVSEVTAGDGTLSNAATTANAGPNAWNTATNWDTGAVPVNTNDVTVDLSYGSIYYGLDQSAVTLASLTIWDAGGTGTLGLPQINAAGYAEYRDTYLKIGATIQTIDCASSRVKINNGSVQTDLRVLNTGAEIEDDLGAFIWKGTHASNAVGVIKGSVSIAPFASETATMLTLTEAYFDSPETDATIRCGSGCTIGTITKNGGVLICDTTTEAIGDFVQTKGETTINGTTNGVTSLTVWDGLVRYSTDGTLTAAVVGTSGVLDFRADMRAKTVLAIQVYPGGQVFDPAAIVTWTTGLDYVGGEGILGLGTHQNWMPAAI